MNHGMTEGLKKSLQDLRENEERYRDAALAIQRVLEAEWALYPAVVIVPDPAAANCKPGLITRVQGPAPLKIDLAGMTRTFDQIIHPT